jgi:hypothetical protein
MQGMNPKVDAFIGRADKWQEEYKELRAIVLDCGLTEELKWGVPCYTFKGKNVVLMHGFKEYCALLFVKGALLDDPAHILITQTENVQFRLDGVVLLVEGIGRGKLPGKDEEGVLFNALGVMSYDAQAKKYKVKAYRSEGQSVDADMTLTEKGFIWGFKEPQRGLEVKYTLTVTPKGEWHEIGEFSQDGKTWTKFIEMTLTRVKE